MIYPTLYIEKSDSKGRGVFTNQQIPSNTIIEISPVVVMSAEERVILDKTLLHDYIFEWGRDSKQCCMALGYTAIYNHSYKSNCEYEMDFKKGVIVVRTVHFIKAGEELFVNYNGSWDNTKPVWFETR